MDLILWPAVQILNFRYVPVALRVVFQNLIDVVWTMVLSYLKHHVSNFVFLCLLLTHTQDLDNKHIWDYWK